MGRKLGRRADFRFRYLVGVPQWLGTENANCGVQGGNDFEIFTSDKTQGHSVTSPEDTIAQCKELFGIS